jgi:predicted kinase
LADRFHARWLIVHCQCPVEIAEQRVAERAERGRSLSEARPELLEEQIALQQSDHPDWPAIRCDTTRAVPILVQEILAQLRRIAVKRPG